MMTIMRMMTNIVMIMGVMMIRMVAIIELDNSTEGKGQGLAVNEKWEHLTRTDDYYDAGGVMDCW